MNISRFFGATNREAMRQVRLALGPDAFIVSNKRVNGGVEILATDQTSMPDEALVTEALATTAPAPMRVPRPAIAQSSATPPSADLLGAIGDLKGSLETRIDELLWGNQLRRSPQAVTLFQSFLRFGFSTALMRAMLKRMPDQTSSRAAFQWARGELIKHLPVLPSEDSLWQPGLALALVGPTGVGKTTTIAKLAARCVRRNGPGGLVLLTTDTYRIGAHEQLKIYGQMLHVPVYVVQDVHELRRIMQTVRADQTVLIDNVGISQRDRYIADQAALLAGAGRRVERLLALNASSQGDTLDEVARSYVNDGGTPLRGCIVTKIDEASCLGAALDAAIRYQLPIHYASNGQKVPEDLLFLSSVELVDRALAPVQGNRTLYSPTEADLAALLSMMQPPENPESAAERHRQRVLLPQLLTQSAKGDALGLEQLQDAVAQLDNDLVLSEAYDLWRSRSAGGLPCAAEAVTHLRRIARAALDESVPALVLYDRQTVRWSGRRGVWLNAAWFDPVGRPLAATMQQIGLADGWYTSDGASLQVPAIAEAWQVQVDAESATLIPGPCHVLEGASPSLMRALESAGYAWLSACSARTSIHEAGEACVVSAAACRLTYQALDAQAFLGLHAPAGLRGRSVAWWAAMGPVELQARGQAPLPVQVFSLRAVDPGDGQVIRTWYALGGVMAPRDLSQIARALILRQASHAMGGLSARLLAQDTGREPLIDRAVYFAQLGLAAWHLADSTVLAATADVVVRMMGVNSLSARQAHAGLLKLFTLKELLSG